MRKPVRRHSDELLETVAIVYRQDELAVLSARLEHENVWVLRHSAGHISADVGLTLALGGVRLLVRREDAELARAVLREQAGWQRIGGVYAESRLADWCLALLLVLLTGVPPPARIPSVVIGERVERVAV